MSINFLEEKDAYDTEDIKKILDPLVLEWFFSKFEDFTPPQKFSVMEIHKRRNILVSSPTGSGKTLSSFLTILNELVILARNDMLEDKVYALYVSPLKALNNDIHKNLEEPLKEIYELAKNKGIKLKKIRVGKRTGDTTQSERSQQLRKPPHIFITTPESLAIMLVAPKLSLVLREIQFLIVDEIHALAENKRGVHLSLSIERLVHHIENKPVRIGLSATISPLEEVAKYLVGSNGSCNIVDINYMKKIDLKVVSPVPDMIYTPYNEVQDKLYKTLDDLIQKHKTTIIFTNTRSGTERIVHNLKEKFGKKYEGVIETHHGSLSRDVRLGVEDKLKKGELKCVVTSTSLELGIDVGYVDLVILLGSPKSIARALQRIGRAGHRLSDVSKGRIIVMDRDDLVECTILTKEAREGFIDRIHIPENSLDILAQHIIGMSLEKNWEIKEMFGVIKESYNYRNLDFKEFMNVVRYLSGKYVDLEDRNVYAKIWYDEEKGVVGKKGRNIRMIYATNVGTIPDESSAKVYTMDNEYLGSIDEGFLESLKKGDRFVLGGRTYEFRFARSLKVRVQKAYDREPTVPAWFSEMLPLSFDLALKINKFRAYMDKVLNEKTREEVIGILKKDYYLDENSAKALYSYMDEQKKYLKIGTHTSILVEGYIDELNRENIIFHTLFGRRVNDALSRAYGHVLMKKYKTNVKIMVSDNGFDLILPSNKRIQTVNLLNEVTPENIRDLLKEALEGTEIFKRRFRHVATRSFMILRSYKGKHKSVGRQNVNAFFLYHALKKIDPDSPVIKETFREIMEDVMDIHNAVKVLENLEKHRWHFYLASKSHLPSPFAHNIVLMGHADSIIMSNKKEMIKLLHRQVLRKIRGEI